MLPTTRARAFGHPRRACRWRDARSAPHHFIVASGVNGPPRIPDVKGLDEFKGEWAHSGEYQRGAEWAGKKVLVVGSGRERS